MKVCWRCQQEEKRQGYGSKMIIFSLLTRRGHIHTKIMADTKVATLIPIITDKIAPDSIVYTDS